MKKRIEVYQFSFTKLIIFFSITGLILLNNNYKLWEKDRRVIESDVISYYSYLPALFIYKDISLKFRYTYKGEKKFVVYGKEAKNGYIIKMTSGAAIMYSPFFLTAHIYASQFGYNTGGYSTPYKFALILSSLIYLLIGLIYLRKILLTFFSEFASSFVLIAIILGTNLIWYSSIEAAMPHTQSFMLFALFIYFTIKWHTQVKIKYTILLGITIGLISLIRPTNIIVSLFFIFYNYTKISDTKKQISLFLKKYKHILFIIVLIIVVWIPQFLYWKKVTGSYIFYSYQNETFFFKNPQIINGLLSYRKGLFIYTPVLILSFLGTPLLFKMTKQISIGISLFMLLNIYIIFSWWTWWYGGSFSQRPFIDNFSIAALPMAAIIDYVKNKKKILSVPFFILFFIFITLGAYHTRLYKTGAIHWDSMTKKAYFDSFGRFHPSKEFESFLKRPDYEAAQKGIEEY